MLLAIPRLSQTAFPDRGFASRIQPASKAAEVGCAARPISRLEEGSFGPPEMETTSGHRRASRQSLCIIHTLEDPGVNVNRQCEEEETPTVIQGLMHALVTEPVCDRRCCGSQRQALVSQAAVYVDSTREVG